jgi:hypothetical protein
VSGRTLAALGALYLTVAVVTFGHSAAHAERFNTAHCATLEQRIAVGADCYRPATMSGIAAGILWPLYWSWEAWS